MKHLISSRTALCLCGMSLCFCASAQSYVTYNHDAAKMNQITVQEIGAGGLTPAFYYDVFHNRYQKTAAQKNKQGFRTLAGVSAYQQVDIADSIKSSLTKRAEIEALNIADRQIDLAWLAEIDRVPCTIALPERVVDAYRQGALPLSTLANAVLAKNDQMRQIASEKYEANEKQTTIERSLAQR